MSTSVNIPIISCIQSSTQMQVFMNYYYSQALPWINTYLNEAQKKELFGSNPQDDYNKINNLWYLLLFIQVVSDERQVDINNSITNPCSYYAGKFTCIIDYFQCLDIDIIPLLCIFGFYCNCPPPNTTGVKGVSIDEITTTLTVYP